jgi:hypothetical protein
MGAINRQPDLSRIVQALQDRVLHLERTRRLTVAVIPDLNNMPVHPQSGDLVCDKTTGALYVYMIDGSTVTTQAFTYTTSTSYSVLVAERANFRKGQSVQISNGTNNWWAVVSTSYTPATGAGAITVTFPTITYPTLDVSWATPPLNPTTVAAGATFISNSWRQVATVSDLLGKSVMAANTGGGGGSSSGSLTGGIGEVLRSGYAPN